MCFLEESYEKSMQKMSNYENFESALHSKLVSMSSNFLKFKLESTVFDWLWPLPWQLFNGFVQNLLKYYLIKFHGIHQSIRELHLLCCSTILHWSLWEIFRHFFIVDRPLIYFINTQSILTTCIKLSIIEVQITLLLFINLRLLFS